MITKKGLEEFALEYILDDDSEEAFKKMNSWVNGALWMQDTLSEGFSFDDLEVWGSNSGETGIVINHPNVGDESVRLKHKPSGKIGYVKLNR